MAKDTAAAIGLVLAAALISSPTVARAQAAAGDEAAGKRAAPATAFYGVLGGPVLLGLEVVRRFGRFFELAAGGGLSPSVFTDADGSVSSPFTWSVMPRLRLDGSKLTLTLGAGLSGRPEGQYSSCGIADDDCTVVLQRAGYLTRLNGELGVERWAPSGFAFRIFAGYGHVLDPQDFRCVASMPSCPQGSASGFYAGLGMGYAF